jgi:hypothetical protein
MPASRSATVPDAAAVSSTPSADKRSAMLGIYAPLLAGGRQC